MTPAEAQQEIKRLSGLLRTYQYEYYVLNHPSVCDVEYDRLFERLLAIEKLSENEDLDSEKLQEVIGNYLFTEKKPLRDEIIGMLNKRPSLKERKTVAERVTEKILRFVETFINGITRP